jgi:hypothetical protein
MTGERAFCEQEDDPSPPRPSLDLLIKQEHSFG